jgi:hypothetical protein
MAILGWLILAAADKEKRIAERSKIIFWIQQKI